MTRLYPLLLLTAVSVFLATEAVAAEIRCDIRSKVTCSSAGCTEKAPGMWNLIDLEGRRFSRCDYEGCDHYQMVVSRSGTYLNLEVPGRAMLAKMAADGSKYLEVATLGTKALVSHGTCK